jgi:8-oxo-dGTP diphosphatase
MSAAGGRKVTEVAVGVLVRPDGAVLLADRPDGKPYAGYWEFPGGKIEPGEDVSAALARELREELGITIGPAAPWVVFEYDYPHAYVRLHFQRVFQWRGAPRAHEGQRFGFHRPADPAPAPLLPAAVPALRWLQLPDLLLLVAGNEPFVPQAVLEGMSAAGRTWVAIDGDGPSARAAAAHAAAFGARVLGSGTLDARDGCVLPVARLRALAARPPGEWVGAWADTRADVGRAARMGLDFVLVGPVLDDPGCCASPSIGWHGFAAVVRDPPLPAFAFGGLAPADLQPARRAGAHGVAVSVVSS